MEDMAIVDPASLMAQLWRLWASFPGVHIAQFRFALIYNCGVIALAALQRKKRLNFSGMAAWAKIIG
jgi:hypothetical protein